MRARSRVMTARQGVARRGRDGGARHRVLSRNHRESTPDDARAGDADAGFDDGRPVIDVRARSARRRGRGAMEIRRPEILKSRAKAVADADAAAGRERRDGDSDEEEEISRERRQFGGRGDVGNASVMERMVRATDEMLDDMETRESAAAQAAFEVSKRAEAVAANPAVKGTVEAFGKIGGTALRVAAPVVVEGAGKVVTAGGKLAVRAVAAKVGFEDNRKRELREKESAAKQNGRFTLPQLAFGKPNPPEPPAKKKLGSFFLPDQGKQSTNKQKNDNGKGQGLGALFSRKKN